MSSDISDRIAPEVWRNSHLSVARFYGGCKINGRRYVVDPDTGWLISESAYAQDLRDRAKQKRVAAAERAKWAKWAQQSLFDPEF